MELVLGDKPQDKKFFVGGTIEPALDSTIAQHCEDLINRSNHDRVSFEGIPNIGSSPFRFGTVSTFRHGDLASHILPDGSTALDTVSRYCLSRYLQINSSAPNLDDRGFISWRAVAENDITGDPDLIHNFNSDDLAVIAHSPEGQILGHLRISNVPEPLHSLPLSPAGRSDGEILEIEGIHGNFLEKVNLPIGAPLGDLRILSRLSRVSHVPGVPDWAQKFAKAKVTTHLVARAFATIQRMRAQCSISGVIFDGESYAENSVRLLGLDLQQYTSTITEDTVPALFYPRYFVNNRGPVHPYFVPTDQLGDPRNLDLFRDIEANKVLPFAKMLVEYLKQRLRPTR